MSKEVVKASRFTIRTSDRRLFRRCFRKWGFNSSLRMNLQKRGAETNIHFWFGSAIHFALEDYHGYNKFGDPRRAFKAYYEAFKEDELPDGASMHYDLGIGMLTYYLDWYPKHNSVFEFETIWFDENRQPVPPFTPGAVPATEQKFYLDLGIKVVVDAETHNIIGEYTPEVAAYEIDERHEVDFSGESETGFITKYYIKGSSQEVFIIPVHYHGTMDKLVIDKYGRWWILDYKTAKGADTNKLDTDDQISAYLWAAEQWFQHKIYGFVYLQLTKDVPKPPKVLKDGSLSVDKKQKTTHYLVREALIEHFGSVQKAPMKYIDFLNLMAEKETPEGDRFIRWDFVRRSDNHIVATYNHIMGETRTMINPNLYLFPNPTRDCIWDCPLRDMCLAMDDGRRDEVAEYLAINYEQRPRSEDGEEPSWMANVKWPEGPLPPVDPNEFKLDNDFEIMLPDEYLGGDED